MDFLFLVTEVGFPIAAAIAAGYFVFLTLKFILSDVTANVKRLSGRIDTLMSSALGLKPDINRIARADGKNDARKD